MDIKWLALGDLKYNLKQLKLLDRLYKSLGKRWIEMFKNKLNNKTTFVVEYYSKVSENNAYEMALGVYEKCYSMSPNKDEITFIENDSLKWWIRVMKDDDMVDLSYHNIEKKLT